MLWLKIVGTITALIMQWAYTIVLIEEYKKAPKDIWLHITVDIVLFVPIYLAIWW